MAEPFDVALLGPIRVRSGDDVVPLSSASQRVLLARLTLAEGRTVTASDLIDALWDDEAPANAVGNLHSYISRLRSVVGADRVVREASGYRLRVAPDEIDVGRAERMVAASRTVAATDPSRAAELLGEALATWRGEPLADVTDVAAFVPDRVRLSAWRRHLTLELFGLRLDAGDASMVLPDLEAAAAAATDREDVHLLLMRTLHLLGRTAEALRVGNEFRERLVGSTGIDPSPDLADLERALLVDDPGLRPRSPVRSPSPPPTPRYASADRFVGRAYELATVGAALDARRIVTVTGPGGVGKTRLALEALQRRHGTVPRYVVELAQVSDATDIAPAVASVLGMQAGPGDNDGAVVDRLAVEPVLVLLDNCEHMLEPVRSLIARWLAVCEDLRILATSRQRFGLPGEQVVGLGPLEPDDQVDLFFDRASLLRADLEDTEETRRLAAEVCALVDGLPLTVELAAGREAVFGLAQLREHLASGLDVLEPSRNPDRSNAVSATVEWSYRLLTPEARSLFDRLSVCRGGFSIDALDQLGGPHAGNVTALLADLVESSLVDADLTAEPPRYRLLETMRRVAAGHLDGAGRTAASAAHAEWVLAHVSRVHDLQCQRSPEVMPLLRREISNIGEALSWLIDEGRWAEAADVGVRVAFAVHDDPHVELAAQLRRVVPPAGGVETEVDGIRALTAGAVAWLDGDVVEAEALLAATLAHLPGDHPWRWMARYFRLLARSFAGDRDGVGADAAELRHDAGAPDWVVATGVCAAALMRLYSGEAPIARHWMALDPALLDAVAAVDGIVTYARSEIVAGDDPEAALTGFDDAHELCDARGQVYVREMATVARTAALIRLGRHAESADACCQLVDRLRRIGMWPQFWTTVRLVVELLVAVDDPVPAARLLTATSSETLSPLAPALPDRETDLWAHFEHRLDASQLADARHQGTVPPGTVVDLVFEALGSLRSGS